MRKLQIFLLETKVWWRIDRETVRLNDNMELINRNLNASLYNHQGVIDLLEETQKTLTLKLVDIEPKILNMFERLSTNQQSSKALEEELAALNDHLNKQSKFISNAFNCETHFEFLRLLNG